MTTPPSVRLNTFVKENENIYIDPISKIFVLSEAIFGYFRLPLVRNRKMLYYSIAVLYSICLNATLLYLVIFHLNGKNLLVVNQMVQYSLCSILSIFCIKRLLLFYKTLNRFDSEVGYRPKAPRHSVHNLVQMIVTVVLIIILCILGPRAMVNLVPPVFIVVFNVACVLEVDFYGHLLNLIVPRLKLINYFIETKLSSSRPETCALMKNFVPLKQTNSINDKKLYDMRKLMDLYHIIVDAYDSLIDAIKWQLLIIIVTLFLLILGILYIFSLTIIKGESMELLDDILLLSTAVIMMIPMFAPCTFGDKVYHEVKRLRELLACRLYEDKLDKCGRRIARALLAFTETRDLTFRLLRMLNIDISLPFKFTALLITYLIILLQFEKVINPNIRDSIVVLKNARKLGPLYFLGNISGIFRKVVAEAFSTDGEYPFFVATYHNSAGCYNRYYAALSCKELPKQRKIEMLVMKL